MRVFADIGIRLLRRWDLDRVQLAALAQVQRRGGLGGAASAPKDVRSRSAWLAISTYFKFTLLAALGLVGVAGILFPSFFLGLAFSYTLIMLMFGLPFLSHCTAVLLDTSENRILLHLPIAGRTLLAARLLGVAKYAGFLAFSISLPTAIAIAVRFGTVALLAFAISIVLTLILLAAVTLTVCLLALRRVDPARVREAILWFQTALFVFGTFAGALVLNMDLALVDRAPDLSGHAGWYFYPPGWMAGLLEYWLMEKTRFNGVLAAIAVVAPLAGFIGCVLLFAGGRFTALLSRLEVVPRSRAVAPGRLPRWLARLSERIAALICGDNQERAAFGLTSQLLRRDAALKRQSYPYVAAILVNTGIAVWKFRQGSMQGMPLFLYCYTPLIIAVTGPLIQYSAEWRAAWCYQVLPFAQQGVIVSGAIKAYISRHILPVCALLLAVSASVWGAGAAVHVVFATAATMLVCVHRFWTAAPAYSKDPMLMVQDARKVSRLSFIPVSLGLIAVHVVLEAVAGGWGVLIGCVAMGGALVVAFRKLRCTGCKDRLHERVVATSDCA